MKDQLLLIYQCHKKVAAAKISQVATEPLNGLFFLTFNEKGGLYVSKDYIEKHKPQVGGYYVVYKDGYKSYSPAEAFETGYEKV